MLVAREVISNMVVTVLFSASLQISRDAKEKKLGMQNVCGGYQVCSSFVLRKLY